MLQEKYLKAKAAETHGLLAFVVEMLQKHKVNLATTSSPQDKLAFELLTHAGESAMAFDAVLATHERRVGIEFSQDLFMHYQRFIVLCDRAGVPMLPKAHLMYHAVQHSLTKGNPRAYTTYIDESLNGAIARVCRSVHRRGWAEAVYRKIQMMEIMAQESDRTQLGSVMASSSNCNAGGEPFDCRLHMPEILSFVRAWSGDRFIHFFDLFAGVGQASRSFKARGYVTRSFELEQGQDMLSRQGFFEALDIVMGLTVGALVLLGPPCSLWVFMANSYPKRKKHNAVGDVTKFPIRCANMLVRNICFLLSLAHQRSVFFILEQPNSSHMQNYLWVQRLCRALQCKRVFTWLKCFGHAIPKPTYLLTNMRRTVELRRVWSKKRELQRKAIAPLIEYTVSP